MLINSASFNLKQLKGYLDWRLLAFLLLFMDVKIVVKIIAIIIIYLLQFNFKFNFSFKNSRLPLFYPLIMIVGIAAFFLNNGYSNFNYVLVVLTGLAFWALCILAIHQVKLLVEYGDVELIHRTIMIFFIINAIVSFLNLALISLETGYLNPYNYQGEYQKYFVSTGDYIKGITFDNSTTNAILNAFGVVYFLTKKNATMLLTCMAVVLLTGSNFTNVILFFTLTILFIFNTNKIQKSLLIACVVFLVVFMVKISPQNNDYFLNTVKGIVYQRHFKSPWPTAPIPITLRPDSTLNTEEKKEKFAALYLDSIKLHNIKKHQVLPLKQLPVNNLGKIQLPQPDINAPIYQNTPYTPPEQKQLADFVRTHKSELPIAGKPNQFKLVPGKVIGVIQTIHFFKSHPSKLIMGDGIGNFSSKLAFRTTGLKFTGGYPTKYIYINGDFLVNHLDVYLNFFSRGANLHSLTNSPFLVYDQLLAEYGLLGLCMLFAFYIYFFARQYMNLTYGIPMLLILMAIFFIDYWFEQLSVVIMFELMIFLNLKEKSLATERMVAS